MILLVFGTLLLFLITYSLGAIFHKILQRLLSYILPVTVFDTFLLGLIISFTYFNLLSFIIPVNYLALIPLSIISSIYYFKKQRRIYLAGLLLDNWKTLLQKGSISVIIPFLLLFLVYGLLPPSNWDSMGYHITTIKWYEDFKVIPGLANVHGRYAFNPANFILSSAYSFTYLFGQAIYPLNYVLVILFYGWLLKKLVTSNNLLHQLTVLGCCFLLFQISLINIASPSSDLLSGILIFYCGYTIYELIKDKKTDFRDYFLPLLLVVFSATAKLSAILSFIIIPLVYVFIAKKGKKFDSVTAFIAIVILILVPWMARNVVLSGCLLYPILQTKLNFFDWTIPDNVVKLDYFFSTFGPRIRTEEEYYNVKNISELQLITNWVQIIYKENFTAFLAFILTLCSPLVWLYFLITKNPINRLALGLWFVYFICFGLWLTRSPEVRFGLGYIALVIAIPFTQVANSTPSRKLPLAVLSIPVYFLCFYYILAAAKNNDFYKFPIANIWLKPLQNRFYFVDRQFLSTFQSTPLGHGVNLYFPDSVHNCINASGPCMTWRYGEIEMRGNKIDNGFRMKKDEVEKNFPFINGMNSKH